VAVSSKVSTTSTSIVARGPGTFKTYNITTWGDKREDEQTMRNFRYRSLVYRWGTTQLRETQKGTAEVQDGLHLLVCRQELRGLPYTVKRGTRCQPGVAFLFVWPDFEKRISILCADAGCSKYMYRYLTYD
jgi:hypothetical protein